MAAGFPAKTTYADGTSLSASDLNDLTGTLNKIYNTAGYPQQLSYVSSVDSVLRPIPFATSTGRVSYGSNINASAGVGVSVTWTRTNRWTDTPIVTVTAELTPTTAYASTSIHTVSTSGFSVRIFNVGATTITQTYFNYHAIQMTSTSADNN